MNSINNVIRFDSEGDLNSWESTCLPIGNGYMGASFFGGVKYERIVLNEKTLWVGGPSKERPYYKGGNRTGAYEYVWKVQKLLADGKNDEAEILLPFLTCDTDEGFGAYQLLCDAVIDFELPGDDISGYERKLDIDKSLYTCAFNASGINFKREAFASYPDRVICLRFSADKKASISFRFSLDKLQYGGNAKVNGNRLDYYGALADNGLKYYSSFVFIAENGIITPCKDGIKVTSADCVTVYFTAATDYSDNYPVYRSSIDPSEVVAATLDKCCGRSFDELYERHYSDYSTLYDRVKLSINDVSEDVPEITKLLDECRSSNNMNARSILDELYFQYGRYLLISSSRSGSLPANLQGVWNDNNTPAWCCDYHINVNLQMNYWGAHNTNLSETAEPLLRFIDKMRAAGRVTAREYYGIFSDDEKPENGWIAHTQSNPFGWTSPGWDFYWGWSTAAVAWLMQNLWEYYEFTLDTELLHERIYPIMRECARFYTQWLIWDENQGRLVSSPTYSPEHGPVSIGNTYEQSLIEQFYLDFITASKTLDADEDLRSIVEKQVVKLKPYQIGSKGQIKEWAEEDTKGFDSSKVQPFHRHLSHLLCLYPGKTINSNTTELMKAAKVTLNDRGDDSTGWSRALKISLWARCKDGDRAYKLLCGLLDNCTFPNLFDFHPPFQIDGNFGGSAGIAEMLLQSHEGYIDVIPAIPAAWERGEYSGMCARGGFEVDVKWAALKPTSVTIRSKKGGKCRIKTDAVSVMCGGKDVDASHFSDILEFETNAGGVYTLCF